MWVIKEEIDNNIKTDYRSGNLKKMYKEDIIVKNKSEFPDWRKACPACGALKQISARKDGTAVYCKSCKQNWKLEVAVEGTGFQKPVEREIPKDGWTVVAEEIKYLNERIDNAARTFQKFEERLSSLEDIVKGS